MQFDIKKNNKFSSVCPLVEKLDSAIAPALKAELVILNNEGAKNIIIDLSQVRYCDSSGLSAILVANRLCKNADGSFILTGLQETVKKLISISQLDSILNILPTLDEAEKSFIMEEDIKNSGK